jgi:hypothetical protein
MFKGGCTPTAFPSGDPGKNWLWFGEVRNLFWKVMESEKGQKAACTVDGEWMALPVQTAAGWPQTTHDGEANQARPG